MSNKIQGEGDYEAARRFNKNEQDFVKRKFGKKHVTDQNDPYAAPGDESDQDDETLKLRNPGAEARDQK